ncbi:MAG: hydroxyectoine utilization dehydratase EutB [Gammaproteobacteria bacterium]|nr:hydroxyectoine utilization dehydratase EutB [Gammaproteobacteria bacterium]NIR82950.1 hydroxyectoine utilization dehydratase EutB [Gammaproteobacteria bacterium]NIR90315.1 hydroxyectoine utilization dehydratase EutB [Gammaproteobacteria bacterium]NIU04096.1 hydroxyectoine utilization dehydratase EutB [Gammaproteobacteria bacterium]NIV51392.1 hydroxyectoine utilization dehydratase EutB [Gammaproteobacteria bacterium]
MGIMQKHGVTLSDLYEARRTIAPFVRRTPLVPSAALSQHTGASVHLKLETTHDTGAFKIRGATNRLAQLRPEERERGVVAVSTGNHGRAVAYAARRMGARATVCMSELVPRNKVDAIRALGAEVRIVGRSQDDAQVEAERLTQEEGLTFIHPFDDPYIVAGQGVIGLELLEDLGSVDVALVGLSGGGLIAGIAIALKAANPRTRIVGISMKRGPAMYESIRAGKPVAVTEEATLADSLGGGIGLDNRYTFGLVSQYVDQYILLDEAQIGAGMRHLYREERVVAEGGAAVGVGALLEGLAGRVEGNVVCIISGNNVDMDIFTDIVTGKYKY